MWFSDGIFHELDHRVDVEFCYHPLAMGFRRLRLMLSVLAGRADIARDMRSAESQMPVASTGQPRELQ